MYVNLAGVDMYVLNTEDFGYMMRPSDHTHSSLEEAADSFVDFKLRTLGQQKIEL